MWLSSQPEVLEQLLAGKSMEDVVAERIKEGKTKKMVGSEHAEAAPATPAAAPAQE